MMVAPCPVQIRGQFFPSQAAAARALGCHKGAIWHALENGTTDTFMTGTRPGLWRPCLINGQRWPSRKAAARALGVTPNSISRALRQGRTEVKPRKDRT